jgi:hypothetical protein
VAAGLRAQHQQGSAAEVPTADPAQAAQPATGDVRLTPAPEQPGAPAPAALSPRNANYWIDVRLDADRRTLTGREVLTWRNISPRPAPSPLPPLQRLEEHPIDVSARVPGAAAARSTCLRARSSGAGLTSARSASVGFAAAHRSITAPKRFVQRTMNVDDQTVRVPLPSPIASRPDNQRRDRMDSRGSRTFSRTAASTCFPRAVVPQDRRARGVGLELPPVPRKHRFFADWHLRREDDSAEGMGRRGHGRERERRENGETTTYRYYQEASTTRLDGQPALRRAARRLAHPKLPAAEMRCSAGHLSQAERHFAPREPPSRHTASGLAPTRIPTSPSVDPAWQSHAGITATLFTAGTR